MSRFVLVNDLRFAVRGLWRTRGITVAVVLSLALGIGGTTAAFLLADALLFNPLPGLREPERLLGIHRRVEERPDELARFSYPDFEVFAEIDSVFTNVTAFSESDFIVSTNGPSRKVPGIVASPSYFQTLGVEPSLGRFFSAETEEEGPVGVLSDATWHSIFAGDPGVVGRSLEVNGHTVTVLGVAPPGFGGTKKTVSPALWLPLSTFRQVMAGPFAQLEGQFDRRQEWLEVAARLRPGVSIEETQRALDSVASQLAEAYPATNLGETAVATAIRETVHGAGNSRKVARYCLLIGGIGLVALIVSLLDVANLLLARGLLRRGEMGIRRVLGAHTGQLMRLLGLETLLLVLCGGVLGLIALRFAVPLLEHIDLPVEVALRLEVDGRTLAFLAGVTALGGAVLGAVAAFGAVRTNVSEVFREHAGLSGRRRYGSQDLLMAFQMALAVSVLVGAALLLQTMKNLRDVAPEFFGTDALVATIDLSASGYEGYALNDFHEDLIRTLESHPRVEGATVVSALPMASSDLEVNLSVAVEGSSFPTDQIGIRHVMIDERFLETLGLEPLRGRGFEPGDNTSSVGVVLLNETAARTLYRGREPIGSRIYLTPKDGPFQVVGVVPDLPFADLREQPTPVIYLNRGQHDMSFVGSMLAPTMTLLARTDGNPSAIAGDVRAMVDHLDHRLPLTGVMTLSDVFSEATALENQSSLLLAGFGLTALLLSLVGLYSLVTHAVVRRTREIGIRRSLGAQRGEALWLLIKRPGLPVLGGIVGGLAMSVWGSRLLQSHLYGVPSVDPWIYLSTGLLVLAIAAGVACLAGRKALEIEPLVALRST